MKRKKIGIIILILLIILVVSFLLSLRISPPDQNLSVIDTAVKRTYQNNVYRYGKNWLKKEQEGMWFMYAEGAPFERGYAQGILTKELANQQETYFVNEIDKKIPSRFYQFLLKIFIGWFNRDLDEHIEEEFKKEIYGISLFASEDYSYIAPPYQRILNYHAAHDIGHAVQNMHLVACTGLGAWNEFAEDSSMFVGRNFDFYSGDDFARDKIIAFINPSKGHKFMSITWGGMTGVLSGMNIEGLTISLNADKSDIPDHTGTPVSIIAREILQYASTIQEAYAIAQKHTSFVSESFLIASAKDRRIAIIEKTPQNTSIYYPEDSRIIIANHFQSKELKDTPLNIENIQDSTSIYRYLRVKELRDAVPQMNEREMAKILRDTKGLNGKNIGIGNQKAINQLIAHHSVIFNPYKKIAWVSTSPFQLGKYLAINLDEVFKNSSIPASSQKDMEVPVDSFLYSSTYSNFVFYKKMSKDINDYLSGDNKDNLLSEDEITKLIASNPEYYDVYLLMGNYFRKQENYSKAIDYYKLSLTKEMPSVTDRKNIEDKIIACQKEIENSK